MKLMKEKLPDHLQRLTKIISPAETYLFGDDLNKLISSIQQTNTALQRPPKGNNGNHHSRRPYSNYSNKSLQTLHMSFAQGKKGPNKQGSKYRRNWMYVPVL